LISKTGIVAALCRLGVEIPEDDAGEGGVTVGKSVTKRKQDLKKLFNGYLDSSGRIVFKSPESAIVALDDEDVREEDDLDDFFSADDDDDEEQPENVTDMYRDDLQLSSLNSLRISETNGSASEDE
jgi:hypothetical protein